MPPLADTSQLGGYARELPLAVQQALAQGNLNNVGTGMWAPGAVPTAMNSYVKKAEGGLEIRRTVLTLTDVPQAVVNGTEYQSTLIYTFPECRLLLLGAVGRLAQKTTSTILSTINGSSTGAVALGSAAASNVALTSTMANIGPSTAFTSSATINVAGTVVTVLLAASAQIDGTGTPVGVYLNSGYATTGDVDADGTQTFTGTVTLVWIPLFDY